MSGSSGLGSYLKAYQTDSSPKLGEKRFTLTFRDGKSASWGNTKLIRFLKANPGLRRIQILMDQGRVDFIRARHARAYGVPGSPPRRAPARDLGARECRSHRAGRSRVRARDATRGDIRKVSGRILVLHPVSYSQWGLVFFPDRVVQKAPLIPIKLPLFS